uniref:Erythrocyte membrane protein 1 n=3 Tax=Plasmodium gaboni TaxID=647221 RepID=A0A0N9BHF6_9APIC|nr:erythrocyte membrane protein 1 [Plasmodium gaboni]
MAKTTNCGSGKGGGSVKTAQQIAAMLQDEAKQKADDAGKVGHLSQAQLKGELKQAKFGTNGGTTLSDNDPCDLKKETHTNDKREAGQRNDGPCQGKGTGKEQNKQRFAVGLRWDNKDNEVDNSHKDVLFPPRRLDMCTSNLEHLDVDNAKGFKDGNTAIHSLLGDVMLTAKYEAEKIIEQYKSQKDGQSATLNQKEKECICRAMKASFADLGDIIRGRDLWKNNTEMKNIQNNLKTIFGNIKGILTKNIDYANDEDPYLILRREWWELNRDNVWQAMMCAGKNLGMRSGDCRSNDSSRSRSRVSLTTTPFDDYIPQRLRWLTEWAEWFCKAQKDKYEGVKTACETCKSKSKPGEICDKCDDCLKKCKDYQTFVNDWKQDWDKQKQQYEEFYTKATENSGKTTTAGDLNTQYLNKFLKELQSRNTGNTTYSSAGGYIDKEAKTDCEGQTEFCNNTSTTYAFSTDPHEYSSACKCTPPVKKPDCVGHKILDAAHMRHHEAQRDAQGRGGLDKLKGDLKEAIFKTNGSETKPEIDDPCKLDKEKHTNDWRTYSDTDKGTDKHQGPCSGKGTNRFVIGEKWNPGGDKNMRQNHGDVLLPPRRQHMCTSNLENLGKQNETPLSGVEDTKINDTFLGEVLLAAKYEGQDIVYKHGGSGSGGICTAMKYSFADLGDIIRGRDMWSNEKGMAQLEKHLEAIFAKIQQNLPDNIKSKYNSGNSETPKHKTLREHWWSANRDQIWKAITCEAPFDATLHIPSPDIKTYKFHGYKCGHNRDPPVDDYIPQRLRWIAEWSENYCRKIRFDYNGMWLYCAPCKIYMKKNKDQKSEEKKKRCGMCSKLCTEYTKHVNEWQPQWTKQSEKYTELYNGSSSSTTTSDPIKEQLDDFFQKVKNGHCKDSTTDTNKYDKPEEFVNSMGGYKYCKDTSQNVYKQDKSGDEAHVFQKKPKDYKNECDWKEDPPPDLSSPPPASPGEPPVFLPPASNTPPKDICKTVKQCIDENNNKISRNKTGDCNPKIKNTSDTSYPKWACENSKFENGHNDACMPPRRQKLCLYYLARTLDNKSDQAKLKEAFIKCAALETYFSWLYYKGHSTNKDAEMQLKQGKIPDDFMRSMFYTYGDYRDLCLDKDIGKKNPNDDVKKATDNITNALKNGQTGGTVDDAKRKKWWNENGLDILQGMICALSNTVNDNDKDSVQQKLINNSEYKYNPDNLNTKIATYVFYTHMTPQFLRWFNEWSEEFCREQWKKYIDLHEKCEKKLC